MLAGIAAAVPLAAAAPSWCPLNYSLLAERWLCSNLLTCLFPGPLPLPFPLLPYSLAAYNPVPASSPNDASHQLAVASKNLFANMTRSAQPVGPLEFIMMLRRKFPQFGERNR